MLLIQPKPTQEYFPTENFEDRFKDLEWENCILSIELQKVKDAWRAASRELAKLKHS